MAHREGVSMAEIIRRALDGLLAEEAPSRARRWADAEALVWVDASTHENALDELDRLRDGTVSLVDAASFIVMRERSIHRAFAFDEHFERSGFEVVG